jgi:hypothetical protein
LNREGHRDQARGHEGIGEISRADGGIFFAGWGDLRGVLRG